MRCRKRCKHGSEGNKGGVVHTFGKAVVAYPLMIAGLPSDETDGPSL